MYIILLAGHQQFAAAEVGAHQHGSVSETAPYSGREDLYLLSRSQLHPLPIGRMVHAVGCPFSDREVDGDKWEKKLFELSPPTKISCRFHYYFILSWSVTWVFYAPSTITVLI